MNERTPPRLSRSMQQQGLMPFVLIYLIYIVLFYLFYFVLFIILILNFFHHATKEKVYLKLMKTSGASVGSGVHVFTYAGKRWLSHLCTQTGGCFFIHINERPPALSSTLVRWTRQKVFTLMNFMAILRPLLSFPFASLTGLNLHIFKLLLCTTEPLAKQPKSIPVHKSSFL